MEKNLSFIFCKFLGNYNREMMPLICLVIFMCKRIPIAQFIHRVITCLKRNIVPKGFLSCCLMHNPVYKDSMNVANATASAGG